jgi:hypothetical protein
LSPGVGQEKGKKEARPDGTESYGTVEFLSGEKWTYSFTFWEKGGLHVGLFRVGPTGKGLHPVAMTVARQRTSSGGGSGSQSNEDIDIAIPVGNLAFFRYKFKEGKHDFRPEFQKKNYDLGKGALFVIDHGVKPAQVEQVKADLEKLFKGKGELTRKDLEAALRQLRADKAVVEALLKQIEAK